MEDKTKEILIWIAALSILGVLLIILSHSKTQIPEEVAKCIGKNSILYTQLGCRHCEDQEAMFGNNLKYLNMTDCFYEVETCQKEGIEATPTWIIKGEKYKGVQEIKKIRELTGC